MLGVAAAVSALPSVAQLLLSMASMTTLTVADVLRGGIDWPWSSAFRRLVVVVPLRDLLTRAFALPESQDVTSNQA